MALEILKKDGMQISYRPELNKLTGSVTATILFQQILHRFHYNGNKPFYKFKEPCGHKLYQKNDSWIEELGFTRREFDQALKLIATKVKEKGPRPNNTLVWYWTDMDRMTFYAVNEAYARKVVNELYVNTKSDFTAIVKAESADTYSTNRTLHTYIYKDNTEITTDIPPSPLKGGDVPEDNNSLLDWIESNCPSDTPTEQPEETPSKVARKVSPAKQSQRQQIEALEKPHGPEFAEAWEEWKQYKQERKNEMTLTTAKRQLKRLGDVSERIAIAMINQSIESGWTGLFEYKDMAPFGPVSIHRGKQQKTLEEKNWESAETIRLCMEDKEKEKGIRKFGL